MDPVAKSQMKRLQQAAGSETAIGTKAKSDASSVDLFCLPRTEATAIALSPRIPAPSKIPDPLTKAVVPTPEAVRPTLVPKRATAELTAQAVRATARYTL